MGLGLAIRRCSRVYAEPLKTWGPRGQGLITSIAMFWTGVFVGRASTWTDAGNLQNRFIIPICFSIWFIMCDFAKHMRKLEGSQPTTGSAGVKFRNYLKEVFLWPQ